MRVFKAREIGLMVYVLKDDYDQCRFKRDLTPARPLSASAIMGTPPKNVFRDLVLKHLRRAEDLCSEIKLGGAAAQLDHINTHYALTKDRIDYSSLCADLRNAIDAILHDLSERRFLEVLPSLTVFMGNSVLFGARVKDNFPEAIPDIVEAGNCIAADCPTAAVFHLMRVAEYGLRALAHDRRIKLDKNKPIDLATWEDLLKKLEEAEDAVRNFPKTAAREAQFEFFHGANMEIKRFKNKFRNRIMHTRESYDGLEAMSAFDHVRAFMDTLASRISERTRTPVIWKGSRWL